MASRSHNWASASSSAGGHRRDRGARLPAVNQVELHRRFQQRGLRTTGQIVLRWHLQLGNIVIPKSVTPSRIRENLNVFGFALTDDDLAAIGTLDRNERTGPDPDTFNVA